MRFLPLWCSYLSLGEMEDEINDAKEELSIRHSVAWDFISGTLGYSDTMIDLKDDIDQVICDFKTKSRWRKLSRADQKTALADIRAHSDKHSWLVTQGRELVLECVEQFEKVSEQIAQDEDFEFDLEMKLCLQLTAFAIQKLLKFQLDARKERVEAKHIKSAKECLSTIVFHYLRRTVETFMKSCVRAFVDAAREAIEDVVFCGMPSVNELETAKEMVNEVARIQLECCTSIDKWEWSNVADVENAKERIKAFSDLLIRQIQTSHIMVDPSVAEHLIPEVLIGDDSEDFEEANGENNAEINTEQQSDAENKAEQLKDTESQAEDEYQGELETQNVECEAQDMEIRESVTEAVTAKRRLSRQKNVPCPTDAGDLTTKAVIDFTDKLRPKETSKSKRWASRTASSETEGPKRRRRT